MICAVFFVCNPGGRQGEGANGGAERRTAARARARAADVPAGGPERARGPLAGYTGGGFPFTLAPHQGLQASTPQPASKNPVNDKKTSGETSGGESSRQPVGSVLRQ